MRTRDRPAARAARPAHSKLFPSFSKDLRFYAKLFQRMCWWFCGISVGYNSSKSEVMVSKFFRLRGWFEEAAESVGIVERDMKTR
jgi:hypothetical protein